MSQLFCSQCGTPLDARTAIGGTLITCPRCGLQNSVPLTSGTPIGPIAHRKGAGGFTTFLAWMAFLGAGAAVGLHFFDSRGLPGKGMSAYDFSTPEGTLRSLQSIELNNDIRARDEYRYAVTQARGPDPDKAVRRDTTIIDHTSYADKYVIVFYSYRDKDRTRHEVQAFEKVGKYYHAAYVDFSSWMKDSSKSTVAAEVDAWQRKNYGKF